MARIEWILIHPKYPFENCQIIFNTFGCNCLLWAIGIIVFNWFLRSHYIFVYHVQRNKRDYSSEAYCRAFVIAVFLLPQPIKECNLEPVPLANLSCRTHRDICSIPIFDTDPHASKSRFNLFLRQIDSYHLDPYTTHTHTHIIQFECCWNSSAWTASTIRMDCLRNRAKFKFFNEFNFFPRLNSMVI